MHIYLSVNVFSTKGLIIGDTIYVSYWRQDSHFTCSSKPPECLATCRQYFQFSGILRPLVLVRAPGIKSKNMMLHVTQIGTQDKTLAPCNNIQQ